MKKWTVNNVEYNWQWTRFAMDKPQVQKEVWGVKCEVGKYNEEMGDRLIGVEMKNE